MVKVLLVRVKKMVNFPCKFRGYLFFLYKVVQGRKIGIDFCVNFLSGVLQ